jgi:hypothetical protein
MVRTLLRRDVDEGGCGLRRAAETVSAHFLNSGAEYERWKASGQKQQFVQLDARTHVMNSFKSQSES